jgi:hypothetical protein
LYKFHEGPFRRFVSDAATLSDHETESACVCELKKVGGLDDDSGKQAAAAGHADD